MAAKLIARAKSPLGHFLRSSALSAVRISAIQKPLAEALRRSLFDAKAQRLAADGRLWALSSDPFGVKTRGSRRVVDDDDDDGDEDDEDFDGEVDFGDDDDDDEFDDDDVDDEEDDVNDSRTKKR